MRAQGAVSDPGPHGPLPEVLARLAEAAPVPEPVRQRSTAARWAGFVLMAVTGGVTLVAIVVAGAP